MFLQRPVRIIGVSLEIQPIATHSGKLPQHMVSSARSNQDSAFFFNAHSIWACNPKNQKVDYSLLSPWAPIGWDFHKKADRSQNTRDQRDGIAASGAVLRSSPVSAMRCAMAMIASAADFADAVAGDPARVYKPR